MWGLPLAAKNKDEEEPVEIYDLLSGKSIKVYKSFLSDFSFGLNTVDCKNADIPVRFRIGDAVMAGLMPVPKLPEIKEPAEEEQKKEGDSL